VGIHVLAAIIIVVGVVVGIIVAATSSIASGVIIAAAGFGFGMVIALLNFVRIWRNPDKIFPKSW
jgi:hypothetical protein